MIGGTVRNETIAFKDRETVRRYLNHLICAKKRVYLYNKQNNTYHVMVLRAAAKTTKAVPITTSTLPKDDSMELGCSL